MVRFRVPSRVYLVSKVLLIAMYWLTRASMFACYWYAMLQSICFDMGRMILYVIFEHSVF